MEHGAAAQEGDPAAHEVRLRGRGACDEAGSPQRGRVVEPPAGLHRGGRPAVPRRPRRLGCRPRAAAARGEGAPRPERPQEAFGAALGPEHKRRQRRGGRPQPAGPGRQAPGPAGAAEAGHGEGEGQGEAQEAEVWRGGPADARAGPGRRRGGDAGAHGALPEAGDGAADAKGHGRREQRLPLEEPQRAQAATGYPEGAERWRVRGVAAQGDVVARHFYAPQGSVGAGREASQPLLLHLVLPLLPSLDLLHPCSSFTR
mmetsp:Transcript_58566/g.163249  ORF Transcript_58566/g.163249 Transcript_58566/m.163249 type:complete len:258 (+) Transcript_58566:1434-2207(+)